MLFGLCCLVLCVCFDVVALCLLCCVLFQFVCFFVV